jgi:hypothetical protein
LTITAACGPGNFFGDTDADTASTDSDGSDSGSPDDDVPPDPSVDPDPTATPDPTTDPDPTGMPPPDPVPTCAPVVPAGPACPDALQQPTIIYDAAYAWSGAIAIDDAALYPAMSDDDFGGIAHVDKCTGEIYALATDIYAAEIVATNDAIMWSDPFVYGGLLSAPKSGGDPTLIVGDLSPYALVVAGDLLVFSTDNEVWRASMDGSMATPYDVPPGNAYALAYDGQSIFFADYDGNIYQLDPVSGAYELFLSDQADAVFAADCEYVFWRDWNLMLRRTHRETLSSSVVWDVPVYGVAHDTETIYVGMEGSLLAFDKDTLEPVELASHPDDWVVDVAVDATHVYWMVANDAELWAAPKL